MTTGEMIAVMQAFEDGKEIECMHKDGNIWLRVEHPVWDWPHCDYRIKPEPKYVPYNNVSEVEKGKWIVNKNGSITGQIGAINDFDGTVYLLGYGGWKKLDTLFLNYTYEDGTPCGKLVEE